MVLFNLWLESFVFGILFLILVGVPCLIVGIMGKRMIDNLGRFPTKSPAIQTSVFYKLITVEVITFLCFLGFYNFFSS